MSKITSIVTNFTAGEFSPQLYGRVDIAKYFNAVETLENFFIQPYGGIVRRPGTVHVAEVKDSSKITRLIPFQFSTDQAYVLEFGDQYIRFYMDNGAVVETATTITGVTQANPAVVTTSAPHGYSNGDEIFISGVVGMTEINSKRFIAANVGAATFELTGIDSTAYIAYTSGGTAEKIYEIATTFLEADLADIQYAQSADVLFLVHPNYKPKRLSRTGHTSWTLADIAFAGGPFMPDNVDATKTLNPSVTVGAGTLTAVGHTPFTADHVGSFWKVGGLVASVQGYVEVTGFTSSTLVSITVKETLDAIGATSSWAEGSWSDERGYPQTVTFFEQRWYVGGSPSESQTIWGSVIETYDDFTAGANDDDAVVYTIATEQVNAIRWLSAGKGLAVGTAGGVFILSSGSDTLTVTPSNILVHRETTYGAMKLLPKRVGEYVYYFQRDQRTLREFSYNIDIDGHRALDETILAEHITRPAIVDLTYQQAPLNILWAVRSDGEIACLTRQIEQDVMGWSRQVFGGTDVEVKSITAIPSTDESYDEAWLIVERTVDGGTVQYVEYIKTLEFGDQSNAFFVDSGLTYSGSPVTTVTNLDHLEGETVSILGDGAVFPNAVVTDGSVTISEASSIIHVGLPYSSIMRTMSLEGGSPLGTSQAKVQRINEVRVRLYNSLGLKIGPSEDKLDVIPFRDSSMPMNQAPTIFSGDKFIHFPSGYLRESKIYALQEQPLPTTILALMPQSEVYDK